MDHLPNVRDTVPRAEADTPKARALGKRAVSTMGSTVEVELAMAGVIQLPPHRAEGASESSEGRPVPADTVAVPLPPPPPPLRTRDAVRKLLLPRSR